MIQEMLLKFNKITGKFLHNKKILKSSSRAMKTK